MLFICLFYDWNQQKYQKILERHSYFDETKYSLIKGWIKYSLKEIILLLSELFIEIYRKEVYIIMLCHTLVPKYRQHEYITQINYKRKGASTKPR